MAIKTVCFLGFSWEEMDMLKRAAQGAYLGLAEEGTADLLIVNGPSNVSANNGSCVALVENGADFLGARLAGAIGAYRKQRDWRNAAVVLRSMVSDIDDPVPGLIMTTT